MQRAMKKTPSALSLGQKTILSRCPDSPAAGGLLCAAQIFNAWQEARELGVSGDRFADDLARLVYMGYLETVKRGYYRLTPAGRDACGWR
ncbi:MAG: hypothetical protein KGL10_00520 [Alphaproteobacteria bacterium]|nr:hypothetical protein [Alphaproteobacteria bacterium]MDE2335776.1 hypothetical protein [Alphaproteobacteria bacterium]